MKYRNIIFDFDGTLADTAELTVETMHKTNRALNLPDKSDAECRAMIGYRLEEIPSILWPDMPDLSERYAATFREIYKSTKEDFKVRTYSGVSDTLTRLKRDGIRMAVASSRSKVSLLDLCNELRIADYFQMIVGGGDVNNGKPAPDPVNLVLATQGWDKDETLVVGDMSVDILMGKAAGAATCGVIYGNGSVAELRDVGADYLISDFSELKDLLN
mgnify:FL=1